VPLKIEIQDDALGEIRLTPDQARLELAVGLFSGRTVTLGRAARVSGLAQSDFLKELGRREIPIHYDPDDFEADLKTIAALNDR
jgi:predicted HTH domain antitoxin